MRQLMAMASWHQAAGGAEAPGGLPMEAQNDLLYAAAF
jgi:hypothetical protein